MKTMQTVTLENTQAGHSKEYRLSLEAPQENLFMVVALWGKIGTSLTRTVKFSGDQAQAEKQYAKILNGQLSKGYVIVGEKNDGQTAATTGTQAPHGTIKKVIARIPPMLCGPLQDRAELEPYLLNDRYVLEEKFNGTRKEVLKTGNTLVITNKQGQPTGKGMLPVTQAEFLKVPFDFTVDIEDEPVGGGCVLLDILTLRGKPVDHLVRQDRRPLLETFYLEAGFDGKIVRLSEQAVGQKAKRSFLTQMENQNAEGVIVKDNAAGYVGGEAGRKHQWKYKFQATASFIVDQVGIGGKRNIGLALLDGTTRIHCGKCAVPVNKSLDDIAVNDVVECRYLYAEPGSNKLNQPFYLGKRDDVEPTECQLAQLKYKAQPPGK